MDDPGDQSEDLDAAEDDLPEAGPPADISTSSGGLSDTEWVGPPAELAPPPTMPVDSISSDSPLGEHGMDSQSSIFAANCAPAERRPVRMDTVNVHELDGEALIFDPGTGDTHRLNETALLIWNCCDGTHDVTEIARALAEVYEVSAEEARDHVDRILKDFDDRGLLLIDE